MCEFRFPFSSHGRGFELLGHRGDEGAAFLGGNKVLCLAAALPREKPFLYQLFDGGRPGGGRPDAPALGFFWHGVRAGGFHGGQQGILGEVFGRGGAALFQLGIHNRERFLVLCFCQNIQIFLDLFGGIAKNGPLHSFPALIQNRPAFSREGLSGTLKLHSGFSVAIRLAHGGQQSGNDQTQDACLASRQRRKVSPGYTLRRQNGVVVADLFAIDDLFSVNRNSAPKSKRCRRVHDQAGQTRRHVLGEVAAVGAGVSHQFLFIERLGIIEGLLR